MKVKDIISENWANNASLGAYHERAQDQRIMEKSRSEKQARTMAAAAHNPAFARKLGIKSSVAKEFNRADTGTQQLSNAMKHKKLKEVEGVRDVAASWGNSPMGNYPVKMHEGLTIPPALIRALMRDFPQLVSIPGKIEAMAAEILKKEANPQLYKKPVKTTYPPENPNPYDTSHMTANELDNALEE